MTNTEINADEPAAEEAHRYWPDVGQAPIAYYIRENLQDFLKRFEDLPPGIVLQQLRWISDQLYAVEKANAVVEAAVLCKPTTCNDSQLSDEMDRLDIEAADPVWKEIKLTSRFRSSGSSTPTQS